MPLPSLMLAISAHGAGNINEHVPKPVERPTLVDVLARAARHR